ncbi:hypothetical protein [Shewanella nanhaiensis]|uniref:Uncharacterized protein n=1 Tax=Shewanella nanhaiensis TaxID=2864872 RepID=A0ABS7E0X7_9GAMM|nr:hypothetical protein [Shewanella nanhaiensis]MBW8183368.1 hypothetical protein [Shewanella nanhaiensis]
MNKEELTNIFKKMGADDPESWALSEIDEDSTLDTFNFQALGFYKKQGYVLVGHLMVIMGSINATIFRSNWCK